jgi:UDP-N-acetylmuramoyl-L-alanyl-D-glutamate--2,6-diaminopimelate ligase
MTEASKKYVLNVPITHITADSRQAAHGSLFMAYPGEHVDGRDYIDDAIKNGATAVLWDDADFKWKSKWKVENIAIKQLRWQAGPIADQFYQQPSSHMWTIGVTGTNGKTSITQWLSQCFNYLGRKTAVLGTLGNGLPHQITPTENTTPDAILLQGMLADYLQQGAEIVAMEVSSHGLHQGRVNGVHFDVAVLSNFSRDHLDYHATYEEYAAEKQRLFEMRGLKMAIVNADDEFGQKIENELIKAGTPVSTYGIDDGEIRATELYFEDTHFAFYAITPVGNAQIIANLIGRFNVYNVLAVLATLLASKVSLADAVEAISHIQSAAGRMQQLGGGRLPLVVVDYAHTPDALQKVLETLKEQLKPGAKLICVFGCGGDRDIGKRPLMGKVASELADGVIVTSDNPRSEDASHIIQDILSDMQGNYALEEDRAKAIATAILAAKTNDIVLIAGKGHEDYQEIAGVKHHFSDVEQVQIALKKYAETLT